MRPIDQRHSIQQEELLRHDARLAQAAGKPNKKSKAALHRKNLVVGTRLDLPASHDRTRLFPFSFARWEQKFPGATARGIESVQAFRASGQQDEPVKSAGFGYGVRSSDGAVRGHNVVRQFCPERFVQTGLVLQPVRAAGNGGPSEQQVPL